MKKKKAKRIAAFTNEKKSYNSNYYT